MTAKRLQRNLELRRRVSGSEGTSSYEFGPYEEIRIARLAKRVRRWGIVSLVLGILGIAFFFLVWFVLLGPDSLHAGLLLGSFIAMAPVLVVNAAIAFLYIGAGKALQQVVDTQHRDVPHLLDGLARVSGAFRIETILGSIGVIAGAITLFKMFTS